MSAIGLDPADIDQINGGTAGAGWDRCALLPKPRADDMISSHQFEEEIGDASSENGLFIAKMEFSVQTACGRIAAESAERASMAHSICDSRPCILSKIFGGIALRWPTQSGLASSPWFKNLSHSLGTGMGDV